MQLTDPSLVDPSVFWFWNDTPTHQEIDDKLDAFLAKGFLAVYVHPMPQTFRPADFHGGMETTYLSPEFFELIAYTCSAMKSRKMSMWLYDEGGWPSGMAGGRVVAEDPAHGVWMLNRVGDSIRPTQLVSEIAYPDLMNPAATDCFIRHTHEKYRKCIGDEFGHTVRGIFTDEPRLIGRVGTDRIPWSPLLPKAFQSDHGYDVNDVLPVLFEPAADNENVQKVQRDYRATISRLIAENYYQRIRNWCEKNHLLFEGHHSGEDNFASHGQYFGDYLQQARHYHIPGADTIWRQIFPGQPGGNYVKLASSSAWLRGSRIAVSESFAVYGAGLTLEQMKWIAAFQIVRGVNKIGAMASLQSVRGGRRINLCTDISPMNPIWRDVDLWTDLVRSAARFSIKGKPQANVGIFYRGELTSPDEASAFNQAHEAICDRLNDQLIGWVFVGADALSSMTACSDGIQVGAVVLSALIVHIDGSLGSAEIEILEKVASAGVRVLWIGDVAPPVNLRQLKNFNCIADSGQIELGELSPVKTDIELSGVRLLALRDDDWRGYLFFNQNPTAIKFAFQSRDGGVAGGLETYELDSSAMPELHEDRATEHGLQISLHPGEMRAFQTRLDLTDLPKAMEAERTIELGRHWKVQQEQSFQISDDVEISTDPATPADCDQGDFASQHPEFSGSLLYHTTLLLPDLPPDAKVILDLGTVWYSAEVWCNGRQAGRRAWSPYWFDVTSFIESGSNEFRIQVTNMLANQWARPDIRERDLRQWRNMYLDTVIPFITESLHSGLAGPVVLRVLKLKQE